MSPVNRDMPRKLADLRERLTAELRASGDARLTVAAPAFDSLIKLPEG